MQEKKGLTEEQRRKIKHIVYDEFFGNRLDYIICRNSEGVSRYIHETKLSSEKDYTALAEEEAEAYRNRIHEERLQAAALSPVELTYKKSFLEQLQKEDESIHGQVTEEKIRKNTEASSADYYDETFFEKLSRYQFLIFVAVILISFAVYYFVSIHTIVGNILIKSSHSIKEAYLNNEKESLDSNNILKDISKGHYTLKIITDSNKVFEREVDIYEDKTIVVDFDFIHQQQGNNIQSADGVGYVRILSNQTEFTAFLDKKVVQNGTWLEVESGNHDFEVKKEAYESLPPFRSYYVSDGDSLDVHFQLQKVIKGVRFYSGTIEVSSNIRGAEIFLNGKKTGNQSNHFFNNMAKGSYTISVRKAGYRNLSGTQKVLLTDGIRYRDVKFKLEKSASFVSIRTKNRDGEIFINGKSHGNGIVTESLASGSYSISFGKISGFHTPKKRTLTVSSEKNSELIVAYFPIINYKAIATTNTLSSTHFKVSYGYQQFGRFVEDNSKRAKFKSDKNGKTILEMSYPFPYNNPVAGHAIKLDFTLPAEFSFEQALNLYLSLYASSESYATLTAKKAEFSLIVNNKARFASQKVTYTTSSSNYPKQVFKINSMLRNGPNEIVLMLTNSNTTVLELRSIELRR